MNQQPAKSWTHCVPRAFTLVEVVASIMLLGTLLVAILSAHRRHGEQIRGAKARADAVALADRLLSDWRQQGLWGAATSTGQFPDRTDVMWRWTVKTNPELVRLGGAIGRLEVLRKDSPSGEPLASVELLTTAGAVPSTKTQVPAP